MVKYYANGTPFIPFSEMMEKLREKYPNVKIHVDVNADPAHEPNTWVATCKIWESAKEATETNYIIAVAARRSPSDAASEEESSDIMPYDAVQVAAIRKALILLGLGLSTAETETLKNEYIDKISSVSNTTAPIPAENKEEHVSSAPAASTVVPAETVKTEAPETEPIKEKSSKKTEPSKTDSKVEPEVKPTEDKPTVEATKVEKKAEEPAKPEKKSPKNKSKTAEEEKAVIENESNMTLEEAMAMPCNWQSREETLGELMENDYQLFSWMSSSTMYAKRHPKEYAAIQLIMKLKK